jgi:uncharacterized protein
VAARRLTERRRAASDTLVFMTASHGVVHRYVEAWKQGDIVTVIDCYSPSIVAHYGGTSPFAGTHVGRDAFLQVLADSTARSGRRLVSVDQVHEDASHGAVFATEEFMVDGDPVTVNRALRYRIEDDRIVECWLYDQDQHLVDRAWRA